MTRPEPGPEVRLEPGTRAADVLKVPAREAQRILRTTVRLVADLPRGSSPEVVWAHGASELIVHTDGLELSCLTGLVTVTIPVACDQLRDGGRVDVPFAVGTLESPTGLVMTTLTRPSGPAVVVDAWTGPLVAFAWEALLHLAQQLCAAAGKDSDGRPLVPGYIAAARGTLLIQPMARREAGRP